MLYRSNVQSFIDTLSTAILTESALPIMEASTDVFKPVGKEEYDDGVRYFELDHPATNEMRHTNVRILDEKDGKLGNPSKWFKVEKHPDDGSLGFKANGNDWFPIDHIEYNDKMEPIQLTPEAEPEKKKEEQKKPEVKKETKPINDPVDIWLWMITTDWDDVDTRTLCAIYAPDNFPSRAFVDKIRIICDAKVQSKGTTITVLSKTVKDGYPVFRFDLSLIDGKYPTDEQMQAEIDSRHITNVFTPNEFLAFLREYIHKLNSYKLSA